MRPMTTLGNYVLGSVFLCTASAALAQSEPTFSKGFGFSQQSGKALYHSLCAGCHMPNGQGAQAAGRYPALSANPRLVSTAYIASLVMNGYKAMPTFADQLSDQQVAAVANYVQSQFGKFESNQTIANITEDEVKALRPTFIDRFKHY